ncbi:unknown [Clostridium sp. CAG:729]|nr:unknown [Clostridium sp. CAG:729]
MLIVPSVEFSVGLSAFALEGSASGLVCLLSFLSEVPCVSLSFSVFSWFSLFFSDAFPNFLSANIPRAATVLTAPPTIPRILARLLSPPNSVISWLAEVAAEPTAPAIFIDLPNVDAPFLPKS